MISSSGSLALLAAALSLGGSAVTAMPAASASSEIGTFIVEYGGEKIELPMDPSLAIKEDSPAFRAPAPEMIEINPEVLAGLGPPDLDALDFDWSVFNETDTESESEEPTAHGLKKRNTSSRNYDRGFPYSAIGKVLWENGVWCSGSLVGPRHLITARHCIPSSGRIRFVPWWSDGETVYPGSWAPVSNIVTWPWSDAPDCPLKDDWAVAILNERLGDARGWFGMDLAQTRFINQPWMTSCGYPGGNGNSGRFMFCHHNVVLEHFGSQCGADGGIRTNAQVSGGQSGSGLYFTESPRRRIVGVLHGHSAGKSYFAAGQNMLDVVSYLRAAFP